VKAFLRTFLGYIEFSIAALIRFYYIGKFSGLPLGEILNLLDIEQSGNSLVVSNGEISDMDGSPVVFRRISGQTLGCFYWRTAQLDEESPLREKIFISVAWHYGYINVKYHQGSIQTLKLHGRYRRLGKVTRQEDWILRQICQIVKDVVSIDQAAHAL
jgi:hypothetical protein